MSVLLAKFFLRAIAQKKPIFCTSEQHKWGRKVLCNVFVNRKHWFDFTNGIDLYANQLFE
jgi:hypothetical protein